jgi:[ribosomal protein S18]-alanine N-acetyltransferase
MAPEREPLAAVAWKVRAFHPPDAQAISETLRSSREAAQWPAESYAKLASTPGGVLLVCDAKPDANTVVVGFVAARQADDEAEILNIAVHPDFRRKGIASALLLAVLDKFRSASVARVFLELRESNLPARTLYQRHGFVPSGRRKCYYQHPTEDALCMHKELTRTLD